MKYVHLMGMGLLACFMVFSVQAGKMEDYGGFKARGDYSGARVKHYEGLSTAEQEKYIAAAKMAASGYPDYRKDGYKDTGYQEASRDGSVYDTLQSVVSAAHAANKDSQLRVFSETVREYSVDGEKVKIKDSGERIYTITGKDEDRLSVRVFEKKDATGKVTEVGVTFGGTDWSTDGVSVWQIFKDSGSDARDDAKQLVHFAPTPQAYKDAAEALAAVMAVYKDTPINVYGHSEGGGEAMYSVLKNGVWNGNAPINYYGVNSAGLNGLKTNNVINPNLTADDIRNHFTLIQNKDEWCSTVGYQFGEVVLIPNTHEQYTNRQYEDASQSTKDKNAKELDGNHGVEETIVKMQHIMDGTTGTNSNSTYASNSATTNSGNTNGGNTTRNGTRGNSSNSTTTNGGNTSGGYSSGGSTNGRNTNGGNANSGSANSGSKNGGSTNGGNTNGGSTNGGNANGGSTNGGNANGGNTNGGNTNGGNSPGVAKWRQVFFEILNPTLPSDDRNNGTDNNNGGGTDNSNGGTNNNGGGANNNNGGANNNGGGTDNNNGGTNNNGGGTNNNNGGANNNGGGANNNNGGANNNGGGTGNNGTGNSGTGTDGTDQKKQPVTGTRDDFVVTESNAGGGTSGVNAGTDLFVQQILNEYLHGETNVLPPDFIPGAFNSLSSDKKEPQTIANEAFNKAVDSLFSKSDESAVAQAIKDYVSTGGDGKDLASILDGNVSATQKAEILNLTEALSMVKDDGGKSLISALGDKGQELADSLLINEIKGQISSALPQDQANTLNSLIGTLDTKGLSQDAKNGIVNAIKGLVEKNVPEHSANVINGILQDVANGKSVNKLDEAKNLGKSITADTLKTVIEKNLDPSLAQKLNALIDGYMKNGAQGLTETARKELDALIDQYAPGQNTAKLLKETINGVVTGQMNPTTLKDATTAIVTDTATQLINNSNLSPAAKAVATQTVNGLASNGLTGITSNIRDFITDAVTDQLGEDAGKAVGQVFDAIVTPGVDPWQELRNQAPTIGIAVAQRFVKEAEKYAAGQIDKLISKFPGVKTVLDKLGINGEGIVQGCVNVLGVLLMAPDLKTVVSQLSKMGLNFLKGVVAKLIDWGLEWVTNWVNNTLVPKVMTWASNILGEWANNVGNELIRKGLLWLQNQCINCQKHGGIKIKTAGTGEKVITAIEKLIKKRQQPKNGTTVLSNP